MTRTINTLLGLLAFVLVVRLGLTALLPFADTTEPRYAEIARIMAETGDWITPWFDYGVPFWGKPPLSFWTQALSFKLFGVNEFAGRLPSWLANVGIVYLVYATTRWLHASPGSDSARITGLWAAIIYSTMALGFVSAGTVMTDSFLALATTLVIASLVIRLQGGTPLWGWLFFIGLALGLLAKGPLVLVLTGLPVFVWVALNRQWHTLWQTLPWVRGTALMLLIALPWYILAELKTPGFFDYFIIGEHFKRFLVSGWEGDLYGSAHDRARGTIWLYLVQASFPWGLIAAATWAWSLLGKQSSDDIWHTQYPGLTTMLIAAALTPAVFFTFSGNVLWTYILPGLPFLAILTAGLLQRNGKPSLTKFALASSLAIPILGTAAGAWFAVNPGQLKTERELVQRIDAMPEYSPADLFYLDEAPFSARFYTQGQVNTVDSKILKSQIASDYWAKGKLFAEMKGGQSVIKQLAPSAKLIDSSRRYRVYQVAPVANQFPDVKTAPKGQ
ncbi:ArnT family glycosyltransferase [Marinobacter persicus]|uniref:Dolichyl-phosphate-mannose-protein mannosyltransferase n=1 Tax=Marinobacter persicus TaxID=930118 RepID=A0A2S6G9V3_9GAMM|nr:glycosyltransferase family 39 protein [Marinobacter persicus]PPK53258.1 dolichyl-phosphate-mannose-protein mannosyltransferase [Marinobacter persicus]PPK56095.1 dolichyl-phosphate-mannose-protein mannosyltransferase [Marinobacter persicus]PPK59690.1 dolichyl-phosphate-mannose-protein mannosyltransferase [Marinobacter persicus]